MLVEEQSGQMLLLLWDVTVGSLQIINRAMILRVTRFLLPIILPGLPSGPKSSLLAIASDNLISKPARPWRPAIGLSSETCMPFSRDFKLTFFNPSLSTLWGSPGSLLKAPVLNISRLATASPSLLRYTLADSLDR